MLNNKKEIIDLFICGVDAVKPHNVIKNSFILKGDNLEIVSVDKEIVKYDLSLFNNIFVIGAGKASVYMAFEIERLLGERITSGLVVTKYGFGHQLQKIKFIEAAHPVPDKNGLKAAESIIELCKKAGENDLIINLLSGGASALLISPASTFTINDIKNVTDILLRSGASIDEMNVIRKSLSVIKGGGLLNFTYPAKVLSLIISDVIGDKLETIGSGITVASENIYERSLEIINKYGFQNKFPQRITDFIIKNKNSTLESFGDYSLKSVSNIIVANNGLALKAIMNKAVEAGYETNIVSSMLSGESREIGKKLAKKAVRFKNSITKEDKKYCFLYGGETTVTIKGNGKGGRNQELTLSAAITLQNTEGIEILSGGTDGNDGPTEAAGAFCDGDTINKGNNIGMDALDYLERNDSFHYFKFIDSLLTIGPTGTNVMDIQIVLIH